MKELEADTNNCLIQVNKNNGYRINSLMHSKLGNTKRKVQKIADEHHFMETLKSATKIG